MYKKGKETIEKKENIYSLEVGYNYLMRVLQINSNYKNTKELMDLAILKGTKDIYFSPVTNGNSGNYLEFTSNNSSTTSNYIIQSLIEDLSVNKVGSRFVNNFTKSNWVVELKWVSVNISPRPDRKYSVERKADIKEDGKEKTVNAIVNYIEKTKDINGVLNVKIKDTKTQNYFIDEKFSGSSFITKIEARFTGDKRALTFEDKRIIEETNANPFASYEPENRLLTKKIHH
ncbi:hypothetical protein JL193_10295 [Polaribacter batillariae]|uniref:Uncharacterized protein n=1 Tax=Polaribacter batillariae TaxID=2808900 RepID=A0ABX7SRP8_9FLAO|nr:hypothetical protein [Polaribacter batillariae]QTD36537.1 hypothetical protein JL193_10295 [Polaribacter batillariae]